MASGSPGRAPTTGQKRLRDKNGKFCHGRQYKRPQMCIVKNNMEQQRRKGNNNGKERKTRNISKKTKKTRKPRVRKKI